MQPSMSRVGSSDESEVVFVAELQDDARSAGNAFAGATGSAAGQSAGADAARWWNSTSGAAGWSASDWSKWSDWCKRDSHLTKRMDQLERCMIDLAVSIKSHRTEIESMIATLTDMHHRLREEHDRVFAQVFSSARSFRAFAQDGAQSSQRSTRGDIPSGVATGPTKLIGALNLETAPGKKPEIVPSWWQDRKKLAMECQRKGFHRVGERFAASADDMGWVHLNDERWFAAVVRDRGMTNFGEHGWDAITRPRASYKYRQPNNCTVQVMCMHCHSMQEVKSQGKMFPQKADDQMMRFFLLRK